MKRIRRHAAGFTLVELLVSALIISLGLVAMGQLYVASSWTYQKARYLSIATKRAQYELEKVHNLGYEGLSTTPLIDPLRYPADEYAAITTGLPSGTRKVTFDVADLPQGEGTITIRPFSIDGDPTENVLEVEIEVVWDAAPRSESTVRLVTLKTGPAPEGGES